MSDKRRPRAVNRSAGVLRYLDIYRTERLLPYSPADSQLISDLERCLGCGNCLAACPVVGALAEHPYPGPRAVGMSLSRSVPDFWTAGGLAGFCTTCMACQEACPGDVPIYRAVLMLRAKNFEQKVLEGEEPLSGLKQLLLDFFTEGKLAQAARWGAALQGLAYRRTASGEMKARVALPLGPLANRIIPPLAKRSLTDEFAAPVAGLEPDGPRVAVFAGCLYNHAYTDTGRSLVEVLRRHAREVVVPAGQVCCGAPTFSSGDLPTTRRLAVDNARVFADAAGSDGLDFVVTACASCGDSLTREYPGLFRLPEGTAPTAEVVAEAAAVRGFAARVRDIHAFLADEVAFRAPAAAPVGPAPMAVTIHDPCHLARGQGLVREVRDLVRAIPGLTLREMAAPGECCGGAGSFSLEHYEVAAAIRQGKVAGIAATGVEVVVTGCPSCRMHISDGLEQAGRGRPVRHVVDLLAAAYRAGTESDAP